MFPINTYIHTFYTSTYYTMDHSKRYSSKTEEKRHYMIFFIFSAMGVGHIIMTMIIATVIIQ